ncbi:MAG TPA: hypothetical protein VF412_05030 [Bdellovibrio sp.]|uniref:hypothetical protein n=1 Tax=Bdellovibrio sp. TaxID=28201 RepID=UPI002F04B9DB
MKTVFSFIAMILFTTNAFPQTSYELTCRAKAKELAAQTYASCVTESRNAQVEQIRTNYQKELAALKSKYDKELKKMAGPNSAAHSSKKTAKNASKAQNSQAVATQLPVKAGGTSDATPVQTVSEGSKVVAVGTDKGSENIEKEASDADQVEIIETPAE